MSEDMKRSGQKNDSELKSLWGEKWNMVEGGLHSLGSIGAPVDLKHRISNRVFEKKRGLLNSRIWQTAAAACAMLLCAIVILRSQQPMVLSNPDSLADGEIALLSEALDGDTAVTSLSFNLIDAQNLSDLPGDVL